MSSFNMMPRWRHIEALYMILGYLIKHLNSRIVFDPAIVPADERNFTKFDWEDFYQNTEERLLLDMPESRGLPVKITIFVEADHAGNLINRRSHT
eukprot:3402086-Ditylum_brightwellii.AAC.1